jgi:hypothetical protein
MVKANLIGLEESGPADSKVDESVQSAAWLVQEAP